MLFNSVDFLIFFPLVTAVYFIIPKKIRQLWLLLASYYFYMCWNAKYSILILTSTLITYLSGLALGRITASHREEKTVVKYKRIVVFLSFFANLSILAYFKYTNYLLSILGFVLHHAGIQMNVPVFDILLPVGISFYTFQALSYTIDVYRKEIKPERNFIKYALFVSFFPQLVAGPIERSKNLLTQLSAEVRFDYERAKKGFLTMIWGYFLKLVIADRISVFVDTVYGDPASYPGCFIVVATVLFGIQIYCDFAGYSAIAIGAAEILGIKLMENFNAPYLALSVADFWRRWHISLTSWFRDYLYIPLGGSRKGKFRKAINILIVFLVSGLWHGASTSFLIWGGLNGLYQIIGELLVPVKVKFVKLFRIDVNNIGSKIAKSFTTFVLVNFSWVFFRAESTSIAKDIIRYMISTCNPWILFDGSLYNCGLSMRGFMVMMIAIMVLFVADLCKVKEISVRNVIIRQNFWFRLLVIDVSILIILIWGIWGSAYDAANFIYFQF